jgi:hypothetical protein
MVWGGLNPALTSFRNGVNELLQGRSMKSDGGYADAAHGSSSQHQADADGSVDAFDCDNNFLNSAVPHGDDRERRILEALKLDFEQDTVAGGRGHLWISHGEIAQHDEQNWKELPYTGSSNPHDEHTHFQSHEQNEKNGSPWAFTHTIALLVELGLMDVKVTAVDAFALDQIGDEVNRRVLAYKGGGMSSPTDGEPANYSFLNQEADAHKMLKTLIGKVDDLAEKVDALTEPPSAG